MFWVDVQGITELAPAQPVKPNSAMPRLALFTHNLFSTFGLFICSLGEGEGGIGFNLYDNS